LAVWSIPKIIIGKATAWPAYYMWIQVDYILTACDIFHQAIIIVPCGIVMTINVLGNLISFHSSRKNPEFWAWVGAKISIETNRHASAFWL
jgi:hypothetical protein